jgi:hypothetical protein
MMMIVDFFIIFLPTGSRGEKKDRRRKIEE